MKRVLNGCNATLFQLKNWIVQSDVRKFLFQFGDACDQLLAFESSRRFTFHVSKVTREHFDSLAKIAAYNGYLKLLEWAYKNGAPILLRLYRHASLGGQLKVLQWGFENGAQWEQNIQYYMVDNAICKRDDLEILLWSQEHGFPLNWNSVKHCVPFNGKVWKFMEDSGLL